MIANVVAPADSLPAGRNRIERYTRKVRSSSFEVLLAEERERRRLAEDIHDGLAQTLVAARMKLESLARSKTTTGIEDGLQQVTLLLDEALEGANTLTFRLSPPILHQLGFVAGIRWLAKDISSRFDLNVDVDDDGDRKPVSESSSIVLFRSVRELLINVAKHAHAKHVTVGLRTHGDTLYISVEDDGRGFHADAEMAATEGSGFGLFSIHERLAYLGGKMEIHSVLGRGTTARLTAPVIPEDVAPTKTPNEYYGRPPNRLIKTVDGTGASFYGRT